MQTSLSNLAQPCIFILTPLTTHYLKVFLQVESNIKHPAQIRHVWKYSIIPSRCWSLSRLGCGAGVATARGYSRPGMNWQTNTTAWTNPPSMSWRWTASRTPSSAPTCTAWGDTPRKWLSHPHTVAPEQLVQVRRKQPPPLKNSNYFITDWQSGDTLARI